MKRHLGIYVVCIFFFLMLVLPASFQVPRGALLVLILFFSIGINPIYSLRYYKPLMYIGLIDILFSILFTLNGLSRSTPGAIPVSTVYILWPILYLYFIGLSVKKANIIPISKTIIYGGLGSASLICLFIYNNFWGFPIDISYLVKSQDFGIFWDAGAAQLNSMNLATILYTFVFALTILSIPVEYNVFNVSKPLIVFTLIVCLVLIFISQRRAFWMVCLISPMIILLLFKLIGFNLRLRKFIVLGLFFFLIISTIVLLTFDKEKLVSSFNSSFEFDNPNAESNYLRKEQFEALIKGWYDNKLIGNGLGAHAQGSIRDVSATWNYELSYIALLFQTGLVGIFVYTSSIFWIIYESVLICRRNKYYASYLVPQLVGLICFLIANASNPYLNKFDYLWTIFLPLASINALKIDSYAEKPVSTKLDI
jgi:hypothetical protein